MEPTDLKTDFLSSSSKACVGTGLSQAAGVVSKALTQNTNVVYSQLVYSPALAFSSRYLAPRWKAMLETLKCVMCGIQQPSPTQRSCTIPMQKSVVKTRDYRCPAGEDVHKVWWVIGSLNCPNLDNIISKGDMSDRWSVLTASTSNLIWGVKHNMGSEAS